MKESRIKLVNYTKIHSNTTVGRGPLTFLNGWEYLMGEDTLLTLGAATEATSGANSWDQYRRALYRAGPGVASWDRSLNLFPNHTERPKPVFRATSQTRILESARWWLSKFFEVASIEPFVNSLLGGFFSHIDAGSSDDEYEYDLVIIPEGPHLNNTLASDLSCTGDNIEG